MLQFTPAREYAHGMAQAVADRTINRKLPDGRVERWEDVARRVATGNALLHPIADTPDGDYSLEDFKRRVAEYDQMHHHLRQASILMSGRHLQHGDETQPTRPMEVFTNCSTAAANFLSFYLLLNGSGIGRSYDDAMMVVDHRNLPIIVCVCDASHKDVQSGKIPSILDLKGAQHLYAQRKTVVFTVPDSREGWAKAVEAMERMAFEKIHRDTVLLLDFSGVRPHGSPIKGMQNRPASGPGPLINAINNVAKLRDAGMEPWRSAIYSDHYLAECVLVGGARRAARMATKTWLDKNVLDFIAIKRGGFLWSSNNSVTVDLAFWDYVTFYNHWLKQTTPIQQSLKAALPLQWAAIEHAVAVFDAVCDAAYHDQTGEPGLITVDKLTWDDAGTEVLFDGEFAESARYQVDPGTKDLMKALAFSWKSCTYKVITNPCGEIVLNALGGYCVIGDVVPFHAGGHVRGGNRADTVFDMLQWQLNEWDHDAEDAFRVTTRALIRTNLMDSLYGKEVKRTNRIGVSMTGIHEYGFARFGYGWKDLVNEARSIDFWLMLSRFKRAVVAEAAAYSSELGVVTPHTNTTIKPAGTTSKLFMLTEGAHLPSMRELLRWVQFRNDDPLIEEYRAKSYPVRQLRVYSGTTIVGFPTRPTICTLGMGDKLVTAAEATPEEQYQWLRLLEKYWIVGVEEDGTTPLAESGNQVSYTLKFDPAVVGFEEYKRTLLAGQSTIRCCSVMPQSDTSAYEYLPEQPVSKHEYEQIAEAIFAAGLPLKEEVGFEHVDCEGGACPIDWNTNSAAA